MQSLNPTSFFSTLACPQPCEKDLFDGFAIFYDAQIYHAFLQIRRENRKHKICQLTEHFDTIQNYVEHVCIKYNTIIREMETFAATMGAAKKRLLSDLKFCHQTHQEERHLKHFKRELAEKTNEYQTDHATSTALQPDLNHPGDPADGLDGAAAYTMSQYLERITARLALEDARSPRLPLSPMALAKKHASKSEDTKGNPKHVVSEPRHRRPGFPVADKELKPEAEEGKDGYLGWFH